VGAERARSVGPATHEHVTRRVAKARLRDTAEAVTRAAGVSVSWPNDDQLGVGSAAPARRFHRLGVRCSGSTVSRAPVLAGRAGEPLRLFCAQCGGDFAEVFENFRWSHLRRAHVGLRVNDHELRAVQPC